MCDSLSLGLILDFWVLGTGTNDTIKRLNFNSSDEMVAGREKCKLRRRTSGNQIKNFEKIVKSPDFDRDPVVHAARLCRTVICMLTLKSFHIT